MFCLLSAFIGLEAMIAGEPQVEVPEKDTLSSPEKAPKPADAGGAEESMLSTLSLPVSHIRRLAKAAAPPGTKFSSEALAALHRIAQVHILYSTDRAIAQAQQEAAQAKKKKVKGAAPAPTGRRMTAEHVMHSLSAEMPAIASKLSNLMPDRMPKEFKPVALQLLEELRAQQRKQLQTAEAPEGFATAAAAGGEEVPATAKAAAFKGGLAGWAKTSKAPAPSVAEGGKKRGRPGKAAGQKEAPIAEPVEDPPAKRQAVGEGKLETATSLETEPREGEVAAAAPDGVAEAANVEAAMDDA